MLEANIEVWQRVSFSAANYFELTTNRHQGKLSEREIFASNTCQGDDVILT
jgi:hypothetical protein